LTRVHFIEVADGQAPKLNILDYSKFDFSVIQLKTIEN
jgi:hypothetical protein